MNIDDEGGYQSSLSAIHTGLTRLTTSQIINTFGTYRQDALSGLTGNICFGGSVPPVGANYIWVDRSDGNTQQVQVLFTGPAANPTVLSATPATVTLSTPSASQAATGALSVNIGDKTQTWTAAIFPANRTTSWLKLSQYSGTGPAQLTLTANGSGFGPGAYRAMITLQSPSAVPQYINVPVMFVMGANTSGISISSIVSSATSLPQLAPGGLATINGTRLANTTGLTSGNPVPASSDGVSVTVNGFRAPILFRSPTSLRIQIPYEAGAGPAVVSVNNNGQIAGFQFELSAAAPGIMVDQNGSADKSLPVQQGDPVSIFITGAGDSATILTGFFPSFSSTIGASFLGAAPLLPVSVTVGGKPVFVDFVACATNLLGVVEIDFHLPATVAAGVQTVVVTVGGVSSPPAMLTIYPRSPG